MKHILRLIGLEAAFLKKTILLIGVILTAFVAALLSVVSVLMDVPDGMYKGLDDYLAYFMCSVGDVGTDFSARAGGTPLYGEREGLTDHVVLTGSRASLATDPSDDGENAVHLVRTGLAADFSARETLFSPYDGALDGESRWPEAPDEIALDADVALYIGASVGDEITITEDIGTGHVGNTASETVRTYTVTALYKRSLLEAVKKLDPLGCPLPAVYFYLSLEKDVPMDSLTFFYSDSATLHARYRDLVHAGYSVELEYWADHQFGNIALAQAFFGAVSGVLGAMVLFIVYSLIAIFYRQRKGQICRLKLLGATSGTVAWVYCALAVLLVTVAVLLGAALSVLFNVYFMGLCGQLFERFSSNFVTHFRPHIPILLYLVLTVFTLVLFFRVNRKIKNTTVAQEVRHE